VHWCSALCVVHCGAVENIGCEDKLYVETLIYLIILTLQLYRV